MLKPIDVIECCKSLVVHDTSNGQVRFTHYTVHEFIESHIQQKLSPVIDLAKTCLTYLEFDTFDQICFSGASMENRVQDYKFSIYAARFWGVHTTGLAEKCPDIQQRVIRLFASESKRNSILQMDAYADSLWDSLSFTTGQTLLHIMAKNGQTAICRLVLGDRMETNINLKNCQSQTALYLAAQEGHDEVVRLLLEKGADVNTQGGWSGNALQGAAYGGHEVVVQLLLEKGADVNAQGGQYGNALQGAAYGGHEAALRLLLERGADVNAQGGWWGNALQGAAYGGHEAVVRLLLEKGAKVNAQGGWYGHALTGAAYGGHEAVLWLLLEKGADVNALEEWYAEALQDAATEGHEAVVRLLLDKFRGRRAAESFPFPFSASDKYSAAKFG